MDGGVAAMALLPLGEGGGPTVLLFVKELGVQMLSAQEAPALLGSVLQRPVYVKDKQ